jgi:putative transposase
MRVQSESSAMLFCSARSLSWQRRSSLVSRVLQHTKHLASFCYYFLQRRFLTWTKPTHTSLLPGTVMDLARGKAELVAENALLRQQLLLLRRQIKRPTCTKKDRLLLVFLARAVRTWRQALLIVQPETLLTWHRQGLRLFWKQKSKPKSTQRKVSAEIVALIKSMARNNRLWGAERIRGELLKLDMRVCKRTIQKYSAPFRRLLDSSEGAEGRERNTLLGQPTYL